MAVTLMSMKPFSTMLIRYQRNINFDNLIISDTQFCPEHTFGDSADSLQFIWSFCQDLQQLSHSGWGSAAVHPEFSASLQPDLRHGKGLADHRANALPSGSADFAEEGDGMVWDQAVLMHKLESIHQTSYLSVGWMHRSSFWHGLNSVCHEWRVPSTSFTGYFTHELHPPQLEWTWIKVPICSNKLDTSDTQWSNTRGNLRPPGCVSSVENLRSSMDANRPPCATFWGMGCQSHGMIHDDPWWSLMVRLAWLAWLAKILIPLGAGLTWKSKNFQVCWRQKRHWCSATALIFLGIPGTFGKPHPCIEISVNSSWIPKCVKHMIFHDSFQLICQ